MGKFIDLTGNKYGRLLVISRVPGLQNRKVVYVCKCDCGKEVITRSDSLKNGHAQSCGCRHKDIVSENSKKHGKYGTRLYRIWGSMIQRCANQKHKAYNNYGGRGINVCSEWLSDFNNFYQWAKENGYSDELQLDRTNNNKGYQPNNCRFVTVKENNRNRRCTKTVDVNGKKIPFAELCEQYNKDYDKVWNRINAYGWDIKRAITT